jgi:outer membrane biosynthesis protein TonB
MYYIITMQAQAAAFEAEKNRKAFIYTVIICAIILLLAFIITFRVDKVIPPIAQDLIEVNLGNFDEGFGEEQPLIKGEMAPPQPPAPQPQQAVADANDEPSKDIQPDDNADEDAAPVKKPEKVIPKTTTVKENTTAKTVKPNKPVVAEVPPAPKPQKPKATYGGVQGTGNGATEDNGYTMQGNKKGGKGDAGDPSGKPASSGGNTPGGKSICW